MFSVQLIPMRVLTCFDAALQVDHGVHIHFRCWSDKYDEVIPTEAVVTRVKPLHSMTRDRQLWRENDIVDVSCFLFVHLT